MSEKCQIRTSHTTRILINSKKPPQQIATIAKQSGLALAGNPDHTKA